MKIDKNILIGGAIIAAIGAVLFVINKFTNFNKGTPFEDTGAIGTLGNATNQLLGGAPAAIGTAVIGKLLDITEDDFDDLTHTFKFVETGKTGAVNSGDVDMRGFFTYFRDGKRYQLKKDNKGNKFAVRA